MARRERAVCVAGIIAAAFAVLAAACGGDGDSSGLATLVGSTETTAVASDPVPEPVAERAELPAPVTEPTAPQEPSTGAARGDGSGGTSGAAPASPDGGEVAASDVGADPGADADTAAEGGSDSDAAEAAEAQPSDTAPEGDAASEGASEGDAPEDADPPVEETDEERMLRFAGCMRDNGIDFPDPVVAADGSVGFGLFPGSEGRGQVDRLRRIAQDPDLPAARDACESILEGMSLGLGGGGIDITEVQDTLLEFAWCMRDNGVDVPDPDLSGFFPGPGGEPPRGPFGGAIDLDDPDIRAAFDICQAQVQLPGGG